MPKAKRPRLFEYGGQWIGHEPGRPGFYRYWRVGNRVKRSALSSSSIEDAKRELIFQVESKPTTTRDPSLVMFATVANAYRDYVLAKKRKYSIDDKTGEGRTVKSGTETDFDLTVARLVDFMCEKEPTGKLRSSNLQAFRVGELDQTIQRAFWRHLSETFNLGTKSISIYCSYIAAAVAFGTKPHAVSIDGVEREIQILTHAPVISADSKEISEAIGKPTTSHSNQSRCLLTFEQMAHVIDAIPAKDEHAFRYFIIALNTWARPEAIHDLNFETQIDHEYGLVNLNPAGRSQTKKRRPVIRLTENLKYWAEEWDLDFPMQYRGRPAKSAKKPIKAAFKTVGFPDLSRYEIRAFMSSHARRVLLADGRRMGTDQRSAWLGHRDQEGSDTTAYYDRFDPDFLQDAMQATDIIIRKINAHSRVWSLLSPRQLEKENKSSPTDLQNAAKFHVLQGGKA